MRDRWVQRCREQLIELLPRTGGEEVTYIPLHESALLIKISQARELSDQSNGSPTPVDILELATSFFQCPKLNCRAAQLRYPSVLEHSCARESPIGSLDQHHQQHQDSVTEALHRLVYKNDDNPNGQTNLSAVITAPHPEVVSHCLFTLELLGLDPQTTTVEQMNELDPIFECLPCGDEEKGRFVMAWETMVRLSLLHLNCSMKLDDMGSFLTGPILLGLVETPTISTLHLSSLKQSWWSGQEIISPLRQSDSGTRHAKEGTGLMRAVLRCYVRSRTA